MPPSQPALSMDALTRSLGRLTLRRPSASPPSLCHRCALTRLPPPLPLGRRLFSTTPSLLNWLLPKKGHNKKDRKGRPRVPTGGSMRGTTVVWGSYGLRLLDHHRRISAAQLRNGEEAIKKRLRGMRYRLYSRICANIGVFTKGNESRMGKGKGTFDHWASRVAVSKVVFEIEGDVHEQIIRDAFRLAGNKMPGKWEFVRKGDPPVMGISKVANPIAEQTLRAPRREVPLGIGPGIDTTAARLKDGANPLPPITPEVHLAPSTVGLAGPV